MRLALIAAALLAAVTSTHALAADGEYLVKYKKAPGWSLTGMLTTIFGGPRRTLSTDPTVVVTRDAPIGDPGVEYVEPNYTLHIVQPEEGTGKSAWGVKKIGAPEAWKQGLEGSRDVVVAVIDTGVDYTHPALKDNIWSAPDGTHGFSFVTKKADPMDDHSHGTHCSGTIGGKEVGVNHKVSIMGVKFLDKDGSGSLADAVDAINWARLHGARVMSNSWGGGGFSQTMYDAIKKAADDGILFVAAAGNDSSDNDKEPAYPASYDLPNVVSVAATEEGGDLAYFSNYGEKTVRVAAPGANIYSTVKGGGYASYSGTSMATPHVSGAAALIMAADPKAGYTSVIERLGRCEGSGLKVRCGGSISLPKALDLR